MNSGALNLSPSPSTSCLGVLRYLQTILNMCNPGGKKVWICQAEVSSFFYDSDSFERSNDLGGEESHAG
jgi:hypothetical protein